MKPPSNSNHHIRPKGEVYVWVTAMGLAAGLFMILFLLGLILVNGVSVFWPKPVTEVVFRDDRPSPFRGAESLAGVILLDQEIDIRDLTPEQMASDDPRDRREKQLFTGNRDVYGISFLYLNSGDIAETRRPENLMRVERLEWGDAILTPLRLHLADGSEIAADDDAFEKTFRELMGNVRDRRREIERIERREIGRINLEMRRLELDRNYYSERAETDPEAADNLKKVDEALAELQAAYEPLANRSRKLREKQRENQLDYRLVTGEEQSLPIGQIVAWHYPNQLGLFGKTRIFLKHVWDFLSGFPREANTEGGIFPAIFGTFAMTLMMSVAVTPFGVLAAIYLREYARQGPLVRAVRISINNLAGVPSIVFGIFGLGFFVYFVGGGIDRIFFPKALASNTPTFGTGGILWASLTLALMTVPVVIVATEEALAAVSRGVREGSLACGASKWQTIQRLVLPASAPGILTGVILAMARGAGEVAPLMLVGVVALAPNLPIDGTFPFIHLERKFMHLGFHIYDLGFQSPDSEAAKPMVFATTLVLIALVVILNLVAIFVRQHLRKKYAAAAF